MNELRRLLIEQLRIQESRNNDELISLNDHESHYLRKVLRLRQGDLVNVVDGVGNLWEAIIVRSSQIKLTSKFDDPLLKKSRSKLKVCLGVVIPKKGFDNILRMGCEMGVDIFQPLTSDHSVVRGTFEGRIDRWNTILREATEQSERLWTPDLRQCCELTDWLKNSPLAPISIANTRDVHSKDLQLWLGSLSKSINEVWVLIGPEGGWSTDEVNMAIQHNSVAVRIGQNILRTSTAAVAASQLMIAWRRINFSC